MGVGDGPAFIETSLSNIWGWPCAISANVNRSTSVTKVLGSVLFARRVGDSVSVGIVVDSSWVSTLAVTSSFAVDHDLSVKINWEGIKSLEMNIKSISKGRGGSLSPARSTVSRNMLVHVPT